MTVYHATGIEGVKQNEGPWHRISERRVDDSGAEVRTRCGKRLTSTFGATASGDSFMIEVEIADELGNTRPAFIGAHCVGGCWR